MTDLNSQDITEGEAGTASTWILLQIADSGINIILVSCTCQVDELQVFSVGVNPRQWGGNNGDEFIMY